MYNFVQVFTSLENLLKAFILCSHMVLLFMFSVVQPCLSLLCIPDKPGVKILPFYLKEENYSARLHQIKQVSLLSFLFIFLEGHSFAYVAHFVILGDVWLRTQRAAEASSATNVATHLPT
jgi:hypothetical protein